MRFSIVIPLYNRPEEIFELLESFEHQDFIQDSEAANQVEIIVVEDGSEVSSSGVVESFVERLPIIYLEKENGGPASARNFGVSHSCGEWIIFLDSDTVLPMGWLSAISEATKGEIDAFGGPDRASEDFTPIQKAINYSMTSLFTTGGIRGGGKSLEKFHPRSFNMGLRRELFDRVGGFSSDMRFGEDIDLSIRLFEAGARCVLVPDAWVYHKRRVDFKKFYRQVRASGGARVVLSRKHRGTLKLVHLMPSAFSIYLLFAALTVTICPYVMAPVALWAALITIDSSVKNRGIEIGILSVVASVVQLWGYGWGFIMALLGGAKRLDRNFYK